MISEGLKAVGEVAGVVNTVTKAKNAPDMKAAAKGANEAARVDAETKAVETQDVEQIQKNLAE